MFHFPYVILNEVKNLYRDSWRNEILRYAQDDIKHVGPINATISTRSANKLSSEDSNQLSVRRIYRSVKMMGSKLVLVLGVFASLASVMYPITAHAGFFSGLFGFLGGADTSAQIQIETQNPPQPVLDSKQNPPPAEGDSASGAANDGISLQMTDDAALVAPRNPIGVYADETHDEIVVYTVKSGDSPTGIAKRFGITLNTLLWANDLKSASSIKVGDQLVILPVSEIGRAHV